MRKLPRSPLAALVVSASLLVGIALHEGYRGEAYIPVPGDVPTLGFGTTSGVQITHKTTPERALVMLFKDADNYAQSVKRCVNVPLYQHEFDAYVSLAYNIGPSAFCKSTLVKKLNTGDYPGACREILRWDRFKGKPLRGLTIRRQGEYKQCMGEA